jgi:hypothetical protein
MLHDEGKALKYGHLLETHVKTLQGSSSPASLGELEDLVVNLVRVVLSNIHLCLSSRVHFFGFKWPPLRLQCEKAKLEQWVHHEDWPKMADALLKYYHWTPIDKNVLPTVGDAPRLKRRMNAAYQFTKVIWDHYEQVSPICLPKRRGSRICRS